MIRISYPLEIVLIPKIGTSFNPVVQQRMADKDILRISSSWAKKN